MSHSTSDRQHFRETLLAVVDTQIATNQPPATRLTYARLLAEGHTEEKARRLIASVLTLEMQTVLQNQQPYSEDRYVEALQRLPLLPGQS